ncbi:hypothetical protein [Rickettsiella endosymbiont of Dermanyssus gallinae]|uniref:hypothetical protein n=1 Tax=Rickettsiella endosymbiont of Dermanyssus gallinae TaxID=2856608 RepID=UPI001C52C3BC|nr:hypothetical protein [Rickettsiella endosymbiont of Dermanyssus gallinae]
MLSVKRYFIKRREQRATFRLRKKARKKIESIKAQLAQEENKALKNWLATSNAIKKLF